MRAGFVVLVVGCGVEDGDDVEIEDAVGVEGRAPTTELAGVAPGDTVELVEGVTAIVPAPGDGVTVEVLYDGGDAYLVDLTTSLDGTVAISLPDLGLTASLEPDAACPAKCDHLNYNLLGYSWAEKMQWRYRDAHRPSGLGKTAVIDALKYGAATITTSRNSCNMDDQVSASHGYLGLTSNNPNVIANSTTLGCGNSDGHNVVGWGAAMPSNVLGLACTWRVGDTAVESDHKYNANGTKWFLGNTVPSSCSNRYSLRAVASHEFGHTFGLDHTGCKQTMAPSTPPCQSGRRKLGRSDVRGLRHLY